MSMTYIRYKRALLALGALCAGALGLPAQGASFDCAKAITKVERMICDNPELSSLDSKMADKFKSAQREASDIAELVRGQRQWLSKRNACLDVACVKDAYEKRLLELSAAQKGAEVSQPASGPTQSGAANTAKSETAMSEPDKVRQIMTSHRFSLSLVRDKPEESFCKTFLNDLRSMKGITFLKPEIESDSYTDKRWDTYKARCPNAGIFEVFSCDPHTQEDVDSLPEEDQRAEEMNSCQLFRCTQKFRLFKVAGKGYTGTKFDAFYCEHMRGPMNWGSADHEMPGGYLFIDPRHCGSTGWVATTDPFDYGLKRFVDNHNGIIIYKGRYFVFDLVDLAGGDVTVPVPMRNYAFTLDGTLDLANREINLPELEPPTMTPICTFSTISQSKKR